MNKLWLVLAGAMIVAAPRPASAQAAVAGTPSAQVIIIPPLAIKDDKLTKAGYVSQIAEDAAELIAADLRQSGDVVPLGPAKLPHYSYPEVTAPSFAQYRGKAAKAVLTGFVTVRPDGRLAMGCYVYNIADSSELGREGFAVRAEDWRRAAHRCAATAYTKLTGRTGAFGTQIVYVAESGPPDTRVKRIAVMDSDGSDHHYLTAGDATAISPHFSPDGDHVAYVTLSGGRAHVRVMSADGRDDRDLLPGAMMSFAPRFSPDGGQIVFAGAVDGNTDIYVAPASGGAARRLTTMPGIDSSPSFSPDGRQILFASDRSGSQQLYVMSADGSGQQRISFGGATYAAPAWGPDGHSVAFTRIAGDGMRIGVMDSAGANEKILTDGPNDEAPSWSPGARQLLFTRGDAASARHSLAVVAADGGDSRALVTPQGGSEADWSGGSR